MSQNRTRSRLIIALITVAAGGAWLLWPKATAPQINRLIFTSTPQAVQPLSVSSASTTTLTQAPTPLPAQPPSSVPSDSLTVGDILINPGLDSLAAAKALATLVADTGQSLDTRNEALAHLLNLSVGNENALLLPLLESPKLPDQLASAILADALNRPLTWQADAYLAVMARPTGKTLHDEVRNHLAFLTDEDHGDNLAAWTAALKTARAKWQEAAQ